MFMTVRVLKRFSFL